MPFVVLLHGINVHVAFSRAGGTEEMASCRCRDEKTVSRQLPSSCTAMALAETLSPMLSTTSSEAC